MFRDGTTEDTALSETEFAVRLSAISGAIADCATTAYDAARLCREIAEEYRMTPDQLQRLAGEVEAFTGWRMSAGLR